MAEPRPTVGAMTAQQFLIGRWHFDPSSPLLRAGNEERRLEERAARTLELLCSRRGDVVSKQDLIASVWGGRSVSPNSVAVVISDLRRAIEDDPSAPAHILTVNKRGYRLAMPPEPASVPSALPRRVRHSMLAGAAAAGLCFVALAGVAHLRATTPVEVFAEPVVNDTGRRDLDAVSRALTPVVVDGAIRIGSPVTPGKPTGPATARRRIALRSRLILWNGAPELAITAIEVDTGKAVWSGFAAGPIEALARNTTQRLATLEVPLERESRSRSTSLSFL